MYVLERELIVPRGRAEVFEFFNDPRNLAEITPPSMGFRILAVDDPPMRAGFKIEYRIKVFGVPLRWLTTIAEYDPPNRFADEQTSGPYKYWYHEHIFENAGEGRTVMRDRVRYELPFGPLAALVHRLAVARRLRHIFDYRARRIAELFPRSPRRSLSAPSRG